MSQDRMAGRCRYSALGMARLRDDCGKPNREGFIVRVTGKGEPVVIWDGFRTPKAYHQDYIERIAAPQPEAERSGDE